MDGSPETEGQAIPTSLRLLAVMEEVARAGRPVTPTEVNAALGLPKPTIHRLFATLTDEGFLQREIDGRSYAPGRRARAMSSGILSSLRIRTARLAIMRGLAARIGETCNLAVPGREAMVYVERVETEWPLRIQLPIGTRVPFPCTASGKTYLASLDRRHRASVIAAAPLERRGPGTITDPAALEAELREVAAQGYALDREEFMEGMIAIAVPVAGAEGRLIGTLSFHAPTQRFDIPRALTHLEDLREGAASLSRLVLEDAPASG